MSSSVNVRCHDNVSPTFKIRVPIRVNPWLQSPDPAVDLVHCVIEDLIRWLTEFFRRLERVVAAFNRIDLWRRAKILDVWFDFVRTAERVASALHKEHRLFDVFEMFDAKFAGLPGWMKRITEKHETRNVLGNRLPLFACHHLRCNATTH